MKKQIKTYDIVFSGFGASSCILIIQLHKKNELKKKRILILEPSEKKTNDKTFCFWANPNEDIVLDHQEIVTHSWSKIKIDESITSNINPLKYHHISSEGLYKKTRKVLKSYDVTFSNETVDKVEEGELATVWTPKTKYMARLVFDSRPPEIKSQLSEKQNIWQSFLGYKVKLNNSVLDEETCTLMDFNIDQGGATQFVYVLPYSSNEALIELTRFGKKKIDKETAENALKNYIDKNYGGFEVKQIERGMIPMFMDMPRSIQSKRIIPIGTRAHMVKPSTGYAFKNMYEHAKTLSAETGKSRRARTSSTRFKFYDRLLILILAIWPKMGKPIFSRLFGSKSLPYILRFLDEKTSIKEDLHMFSKLHVRTFLRAVLYLFFEKSKPQMLLFSPLILYGVMRLVLPDYSLMTIYILILVGLFFVGIPHGAMDHKTGLFSKNKKINHIFILKYLSIMFVAYMSWFFSPTLALVMFILYSAWHFGETDIKEWNVNSKLIGFVWGILLFSALLLSHIPELNVILSALNVNQLPPDLPWEGLFIWSLILSFLLARAYNSFSWTMLTLFLAFSYWVPLVIAFAMYFIFHHSWSGWSHLKESFGESNLSLFKSALPFNVGAIVLFSIIFLNTDMSWEHNVAQLFVFTSCISLPHILCMSYFYNSPKKWVKNRIKVK